MGKTTLLSLLQGTEIPKERNPTIGLEIQGTNLNGDKISVWDLAGQERFKFMWKDFLKGSGLTVLVCDSTEENVNATKELYERFSRFMGSKVIAIANKQDLPGALSAEQVQKKLGGIKTYEMTAIRTDLKDRIRKILDSELNTD